MATSSRPLFSPQRLQVGFLYQTLELLGRRKAGLWGRKLPAALGQGGEGWGGRENEQKDAHKAVSKEANFH